MQIDLEQITCFLTVARLKSFTKAADVLYKSQPAVSRKVSSMESELNVELIQRGKRNLSLTAAGVEFQRFLTIIIHAFLPCRKNMPPFRQEKSPSASFTAAT